MKISNEENVFLHFLECCQKQISDYLPSIKGPMSRLSQQRNAKIKESKRKICLERQVVQQLMSFVILKEMFDFVVLV